MDATPLHWPQVFARSERRAAGTTRQVTLSRRVVRVRYDGLRDLLLIQPALDPMTGHAGPEHTRALVSLLVSHTFTSGSMMTRATATVTNAGSLTERTASATVYLTIGQDAVGRFLDIVPHSDTSERTAALFRMRLILEAAEERAEVAA